MKIVLAGGGSGGHVYPLFAVAEELRTIERQLAQTHSGLSIELYYYAPEPYNTDKLKELDITFSHITSGKIRRYFSLSNLIDPFKIIIGFFQALLKLYMLYPDAVFSKGGYASAPVIIAAKVLGIPIMIHESDTIPGKVNKIAGKIADRVAISFEEAEQYFPGEKISHTGQPIRKRIRDIKSSNDDNSTLFVLGGSQGAEAINNLILQCLPKLLPKMNVVHQTGEKNADTVEKVAQEIIHEHSLDKERYTSQAFFTESELEQVVQQSNLVLSRSGSGIFEFACWQLPAILVPLPTSASDHQRENAYAFHRRGAVKVIEQANLTPTILVKNVTELLDNKEELSYFKKNISALCSNNAARKIADELVELSINHS
jgi:UDP-N-acetylglucosamine--N-acetylmuramyl-(pentapeptide) pyrophosphoryl-undecaprenol N-acetylglucosamine transferase